MSHADEGLPALRRRIRVLRQQERREAAKQQKIASCAYLGERQIPDVAMMVFVLAGHDAALAADFLRGRGRGPDMTFRDAAPDVGDIEADIEWAYIHAKLEYLLALFDAPANSAASKVEKAARYVVEHKLFQYTVRQNCEVGVAPGRAQLVGQALALVPQGVPPEIAAKIRYAYSGGPHSERKWLAKWRRRWRARKGKLQVRERLATALIKKKAGTVVPHSTLPLLECSIPS